MAISPITADEPDLNIDWVASRPGSGMPSPFRQDVGNPIDDDVMPNTAVQAANNIDPVAWARLIVPLMEVTSAAPAAGEEGSAYTHTFTASDGVPPYTWSVASGELPDGLTLNSATGALAGTPTEFGTFNFVVQVTDSKRTQTVKVAVALEIAEAA